MAEDELKNLSTNLLREWWLTTVQALSDLAGEETAIEKITPYHTNAGIATSRNLPALFDIRERSLQTDQYLMSMVHELMFNSTGRRFWRGKNEIVAVIDDCSTKGNLMALCKAVCDVGGRAFSESFCPDVDFRLSASLSSGDRSCIFTWRDKKSIDDGDRSERPLEDVTINEAIRNELSRHFFAEMWTFSTRAFLDFSRDPSDLEKLATYLHHSGAATGLRLVDKYGKFAGRDLPTDLFEALWLMHHPVGKFVKSPMALECTIEECPFSDSPVELCHQFGSFFNGLCEVMASEYEFAYDRMMTKGDKTCHWTIRKRREAAKEKVKEQAAQDDPVKRLTNKFIDGEITEEEYEKKMAIIKKHYPR
ncbi:MAG: hypothetical protein LUQ16_09685 [Methanomassiliicoccales archaeon]|nr:hypothetical protein [Methanomassiliicoccales archaeon]